MLFGTGFGPTTPAVPSGQIVNGAASTLPLGALVISPATTGALADANRITIGNGGALGWTMSSLSI